MTQILTTWTDLDLRRQILIAGSTLAVFLGVLFIGRTAVAPDYVLLYTGLEPPAAGEVVSALDQQGVTYQITGGTIRVPRADRDRLRMVLAGQGLPANGPAGYELLDSLSGFGTTSQMFDAAYWRAKEGELARTMLASPGIRSARVHISNQDARPFQRDLKIAASVHVSPSGQTITTEQARALRFLVSSAVAGLSADHVTIINGATGEIVSTTEDGNGRQIAQDRAAELRSNVLRLVEAHVGAGNAVVEVNVETVSQSETIIERRFDPDSRIAISSDTTERRSQSSAPALGAVTVASNLPDGDAAEDAGNSETSDSETRELVNYEVSETTREILRQPGAIQRLTVAVLVNGLTDDAGTWEPRPQSELDALESLIASAIGFNVDRGDSITLRSLHFERPVLPDLLIDDGRFWFIGELNAMSLIQLGIAAIIVLILSLFVIRPALLSPRYVTSAAPLLDVTDTETQPVGLTDLSSIPNALAEDAQTPVALSATSENGGQMPLAQPIEMAEMAEGEFAFPDPTPLPPPPPIPVDAEAVARLRSLITDRKQETLEVLRSWMETVDDRDNEAAR